MNERVVNIFVFLIIISLTACTRFGPEQTQAWKLIEEGALILDVRTKQEFDEGHLAHAINVEYENTLKIVNKIGKNKESSVVLYCRSGRRASVTLEELKKLGYTNVFNGGGLNAMKAAKKEYEKEKIF